MLCVIYIVLCVFDIRFVIMYASITVFISVDCMSVICTMCCVYAWCYVCDVVCGVCCMLRGVCGVLRCMHRALCYVLCAIFGIMFGALYALCVVCYA